MLKVQVKELQERLEGQNAAEIEENLKNDENAEKGAGAGRKQREG